MAVLIEHREDLSLSAPNELDDLHELAALVEQRCVLREQGEYTLSSGKTSAYYYDGKRALLASDLKFRIARAMLKRVSGIDFSIVGGVAVGSVLLSETMSALAKFDTALELDPIDTFYVRERPKDWGTQEQTYQAYNMDSQQLEPVLKPGMRALVVDDVVTTGRSLKPVFAELKRLKVEVVAVSVIVDRQDPDADYLHKEYEFRPLFKADPSGKLTPALLEPSLRQ